MNWELHTLPGGSEAETEKRVSRVWVRGGWRVEKIKEKTLEIRHDSNDVSYVSYDEWSIAGPIWQKRLPDYLALLFFAIPVFIINILSSSSFVISLRETTVVTVTKNYVPPEPACNLLVWSSEEFPIHSGEDGNLTSISKDGLTEIRNWRCRSLQWLPGKLRWQLKY